jgi:hypothetical protein
MASPTWRSAHVNLVDFMSFVETAVLASHRDPDGRPQPLKSGPVQAPRSVAGAITVAELGRTEAGTLALRGPMVPQHPFPQRVEHRGGTRAGADAFVDTGYPCRLAGDSGAIVLSGPPAGLVTIGGCRFALRDLEDAVRRADPEAALVALPDALGGHRLAGHAADPDRVCAALEQQGVNALLVNAFRNRRARRAA